MAVPCLCDAQHNSTVPLRFLSAPCLSLPKRRPTMPLPLCARPCRSSSAQCYAFALPHRSLPLHAFAQPYLTAQNTAKPSRNYGAPRLRTTVLYPAFAEQHDAELSRRSTGPHFAVAAQHTSELCLSGTPHGPTMPSLRTTAPDLTWPTQVVATQNTAIAELYLAFARPDYALPSPHLTSLRRCSTIRDVAFAHHGTTMQCLCLSWRCHSRAKRRGA